MTAIPNVTAFRLTPLEEVIDFACARHRRFPCREVDEPLPPTMRSFVEFVRSVEVRMPMVSSIVAEEAKGLVAVRLGARIWGDHRDTGHRTILEAEAFLSHQDLCMKDDEAREAIVWAFLRWALLHELAECFYVRGVRVRDPHLGGGS